jgi:DNA-directed RNA polymerase specialized sigma24 family protein
LNVPPKRDYETATGGSQRGFKSTLWTEVLTAKNPDSPERRQALERLIQDYWKPAYHFIRSRGHDVESAKDLTQGFFSTFLEPDFLKNVAPERGRFRSFILAALSHYLSNEYDRRRALKRGGGFNFVEAEAELPAPGPSPEQAYFNSWASEVLERSVAALKAEASPEDFALLSGAAPEGMADHEQKNRRHRLRKRLRELIRAEILPTVQDEREADAELREILQVSSRRI